MIPRDERSHNNCEPPPHPPFSRDHKHKLTTKHDKLWMGKKTDTKVASLTRGRAVGVSHLHMFAVTSQIVRASLQSDSGESPRVAGGSLVSGKPTQRPPESSSFHRQTESSPHTMRSRAGGGALGVFERVRGPSGTPGHAFEEAARKSTVYARRKLA